MKVKKIVIEAEQEDVNKEDEAVVTKAEEVKADEAVESKEEEKTEEVVEEVKTEEAEAAEEKAEEAKEETTEAPVEEAKADDAGEAKTEEAEAEKSEEEVKEVADTVEMKKSDDQEIVVRLDFSDFKEQFEKMVSPLVEKVDALNTKVDGIAKAAPAEGAADSEETHVEKAEKTETSEDASKEEVKKSDTSSEGASETGNEKLIEMIKSIKDGLEARLTKIESQPAPSKVVVVKADGEPEMTELEKVDARLSEIAKVRDADQAAYMRNTELVDEALTLVEKKRKLMGGK